MPTAGLSPTTHTMPTTHRTRCWSGLRSAVAVALGVTLLATAACGGGGTDAPVGSSDAVTGTVTVLAAASLTESFTRIGQDFESAHPGVRVTLSFAGSSQLARQITSGAPADVFAAANPATMKPVTDAGDNAGEPVVFVRNQLVIAVPKGNPEGVTGLAHLSGPDLKVALCAEQVPCGAATKAVLDAAAIGLTPVTLEQNVKAALAKVRLGEVDAAIVYRTDAIAAAAEIDGIEFAESAAASNDCPVVALADAPNPTGARAFVDHLLTDEARAVLADAGFQTP